MKIQPNTISTLILMLVVQLSFSQLTTKSAYNYQAYTGPDGSISTMVYDVANKNEMVLESVLSFYKYEILDELTSETVLASDNYGKKCVINKGSIPTGDYRLKIYTDEFIITSKVTVFKADELSSFGDVQIASNDN